MSSEVEAEVESEVDEGIQPIPAWTWMRGMQRLFSVKKMDL